MGNDTALEPRCASCPPRPCRGFPFNETTGGIRYFAARDVGCSTAQPMKAMLKPTMSSEAISAIKEMHRCSCAPVRPLRPRRLPRRPPSRGSRNASDGIPGS